MSVETTGEYTVPSNPADRKKIRNALYEIQEHLAMIDSYKEKIKDVCSFLKEEYEMPPKLSNSLAKTAYKHEYTKVQNESDAFISSYEILFLGLSDSNNQGIDSDVDSDDESED